MKRCPGCQTAKDLAEFPSNKARRDGHADKCRPCQRTYLAAYRTQHRDKAVAYARAYYRANRERWEYDPSKVNVVAKARYTRAWREAHPEWVRLLNRASNAVRRALKKGRLVRGTACEWCGASDRKIAGAHHDYSKPLEVTWLCYPCHTAWDYAEPKLAKARAS